MNSKFLPKLYKPDGVYIVKTTYLNKGELIMCKTIWKRLAGLLVFVLIAGFAPIAQANDYPEKNTKGKEPAKKDAANENLSGEERLNEDLKKAGMGTDDDGAPADDNPAKEPAEPQKPKLDKKDDRKQEHEEALKKCQALGCHVPKCIHDWSKYNLNLTDDQKECVKELQEKINNETIGINWCTLAAAKYYLEILLKDEKATPKQIESAKAEVKRIKTGMQAGYKQFDETYHIMILTAEQRQILEEKEKALKEHREICKPQHNPNCPFYQKDNKHSDHNPNEGNFIKYCCDKKHLSEGLFECPRNYKELRKDEPEGKHDKPEEKGR